MITILEGLLGTRPFRTSPGVPLPIIVTARGSRPQARAHPQDLTVPSKGRRVGAPGGGRPCGIHWEGFISPYPSRSILPTFAR